MRSGIKLVYGVGTNDADYAATEVVNGKRVMRQFYQTWVGMLMRCYSEKFHVKRPTYIDCYVCEEWLSFSNFKAWMIIQDWQGKQLDKDLLVRGNKFYSPQTCVFLDQMTNGFTTDCGASRGEWPIGVTFDKQKNKFRSQCGNPFTKKLELIGLFTCPDQAHEAWRQRKHDLACQLADLQTDVRASTALRLRYA